jgi:F0F1-type ATP synthase assembly protein I
VQPEPMPSDNHRPENQQEDQEINQENDRERKNAFVQMANYAQLAIVFPAATLIGWLIGVGLDRWLHTTWLYIVGLILGVIAGFVELIRTASSNK